MEEKEVENQIKRKEREIRDLLRLQKIIGEKELERQIDLRLEDLSKLYKERDSMKN